MNKKLESQDGSGEEAMEMVKNNLVTLSRAAKGLHGALDNNQDLDEWAKEKIAVAKSMLTAVWDYVESQNREHGVMEGDYPDGSSIQLPNVEEWKQKYREAQMAVRNSKTQQEYEATSDRADRIKDLLASKGIQVGPVLGQLDELSKDTLKSYFPKRVDSAKTMARGTNYNKAKRITTKDLPRALSKLKDPKYGQQDTTEAANAAEGTLNEEEYDYYRDYKNGLISHQQYQDLVRRFNNRQNSTTYYYLKIDGKILQQKGLNKTFTSQKAANNYGLAIVKNKPELKGKIFIISHTPRNNMTEGSAHGYNVVKWYEKWGDQTKLTKWLKKEAGLPRDADVYFDDADLVYGNKTIMHDALVDPKLKLNDLLTAVVRASGSGSERTDHGGYYREEQSVAGSLEMNEWKKSHKAPIKPRNFVAKNATTSGAGAHADKKKDAKKGKIKHKKDAVPVDETYDKMLRAELANKIII